MDAYELGDAIPLGNAHYVPILHQDTDEPRDYITAHEALEQGLLELQDSGDIDAVIVFNQAPKPVLIIAGMDVHAEGTQSRIIIGSHLVPPKKKVELPCRCTHDVHPIRKYQCLMTDVEHYSVASPGVRGLSIAEGVAAQDRVWAKVKTHRAKLKSASISGKALLSRKESSSRLSRVQELAAKEVQEEIAKVSPHERQIGLAVISEDEVQAIEIFDSPETYRHFHSHLMQRFAYEIAAPKVTKPKKVASLRARLLQEVRHLSQHLDIEEGKGTAQRKGKILGTLQNKANRLVHLCLEKL
ncbi:MAG: ARPP-1 family domain-containing protein [Candidatus Hermodarchaeia archaeon]